MKFELDRLIDYNDDEILAEMRRVGELVPEGAFSRRVFEEHSRVASRTVRRRFGTWEAALKRAGMGQRYSGKAVTEKQLRPVGRQMTNDELVAQLQVIARKVGRDTITQVDVDEHGRIGSTIFGRRFGSWPNALQRAGLQAARSGQRFTDDELFENLLAVWTFHGRPPTHDEMREAPPTRYWKHLSRTV